MRFFLERIVSAITGSERAKINRNFDKIEKNFNNVVEVVSERAYSEVVDSAKLLWLEPVATFDDLATTYPNAVEGNTAMAREVVNGVNKVYRYNGLEWKEIQQISADAINEVDHRLTTQLAQTKQEFAPIIANYKKAGVSFVIVDDDCRKEAYSWLIPLAESKGFKVTLAHANNLIGGTSYMTKPQILDTVDRGHDIQGHTEAHVPLAEQTEERIEQELINCKTRAKNELGLDFEHMIYPYGSYDERVAQLTAKYYKSGATGHTDGRLLDNTAPISHFALDRCGIGNFGTVVQGQIINVAKHAIENKQMCVFTTHVGANTPEQNAFIEWVIDYVQSLGYNFITYKEAWEKHANAINIGAFNPDTLRNKFCVSSDGSKVYAQDDVSTLDNTNGADLDNLLERGGYFGFGHPFSKYGTDSANTGVVLDETIKYQNHPTIKVTRSQQIQAIVNVEEGTYTATVFVKADNMPNNELITLVTSSSGGWGNYTNARKKVYDAGNGYYYLTITIDALANSKDLYLVIGDNFNICWVTIVRGKKGTKNYASSAIEIKKALEAQYTQYASSKNLMGNSGDFAADKHCFVPYNNNSNGVIIDSTIMYRGYDTLKLISPLQVLASSAAVEENNYYTVSAPVMSTTEQTINTADLLKVQVNGAGSSWTLFDLVSSTKVTLAANTWQLINVVVKTKVDARNLHVILGAASQINVAWLNVTRGTIANSEYIAKVDDTVLQPAFTNGWTKFSTQAGFVMTNDKIVEMVGSVTGGTTTDGTTIFTLPIGYRPINNEIVKTPSCDLVIGTDGTIKVYNYVDNAIMTGRISFANISFKVK